MKQTEISEALAATLIHLLPKEKNKHFGYRGYFKRNFVDF